MFPYHALFTIIPNQVVNGLHEWSDGYHKKKAFKEEVYGPVYRYFLKKLFEFEKERPNRFKMLMASYFTYCTYVLKPLITHAAPDFLLGQCLHATRA
jgi:hypothetical protein